MSKMKELLSWAEDRGLEDVPADQLMKLRRRERAMLAMTRAAKTEPDYDLIRKEQHEH